MEIKMIRKNSIGLTQTLKNMKHHAQDAEIVIRALIAHTEENKDKIELWTQGHNIHIIKGYNGKSLCFKPYQSPGAPKVHGVSVFICESRSKRIHLFDIKGPYELISYFSFFSGFFTKQDNCYGIAKDKMSKE